MLYKGFQLCGHRKDVKFQVSYHKRWMKVVQKGFLHSKCTAHDPQFFLVCFLFKFAAGTDEKGDKEKGLDFENPTDSSFSSPIKRVLIAFAEECFVVTVYKNVVFSKKRKKRINSGTIKIGQEPQQECFSFEDRNNSEFHL